MLSRLFTNDPSPSSSKSECNMKNNLRPNAETRRSVNHLEHQAATVEEFLWRDLKLPTTAILHASWSDGINAKNPAASVVGDKYTRRKTQTAFLWGKLLPNASLSWIHFRVGTLSESHLSLQSARLSQNAICGYPTGRSSACPRTSDQRRPDANDRKVHRRNLLLFGAKKMNYVMVISYLLLHFFALRDLRACELLTSTVSAKRIINSIFIFMQFFHSFCTFFILYSSTSFKFILIFFLRFLDGKQKRMKKFPFFSIEKFKRFKKNEVDSAKATLELRAQNSSRFLISRRMLQSAKHIR